MNSRRKIEERIRKKGLEIQELELKQREAKAYIQAMNDALRLIPDEERNGANQAELREGSMMAVARKAILEAGKPLHISRLLEAVGKPVNRNNRASLAGSISAYVRRGEIFTRPRPNTFGLAELDKEGEAPQTFGRARPAPSEPSVPSNDPPPPPPIPPQDFGMDDDSQEDDPY